MKLSQKNLVAILAVVLVQFAAATTSWANAPTPCGANADLLNAHVVEDSENHAVVIHATSYGGQDMRCSASDNVEFKILRENLETGDIVEIPILCGADTESDLYVDECVPAGTYRYAVTNLEPCGGFPEIHVDWSDECTRTHPDQEPVAYDGDYDWSYQKIDGGGCSVAGGPDTVVFPVYILTALFACSFLLRRRRQEH